MNRPQQIGSNNLQQDSFVIAPDLSLSREDWMIGSLDMYIAVQKSTVDIKPKKRTTLDADWITGVIFGLLILFAVILRRYTKYFGYFMQSFLNSSVAYRLYRDRKYSIFYGSYLLQLFAYITISLFLFEIIVLIYDKHNYTDFTVFLFISIGIILFFMIKKLLYFLLAIVFNHRKETSEFLFSMNNYERIIGLFLFPIVAFIFFTPFDTVVMPVILGIMVISLFYIIFLYQNILILVKKQFSILYLFLYLCALEILPFILVVKLITESYS